MKHTIKLIIFIFLASINLFSQNIYTCKAYTENGDPIDYQREWSINPKGEFINILLDNEGEPFSDEILYLLLDKIEGDSFIPYDSKAITVEDGATWLAYNYRLTEPGEFNVYFVNSLQKRLVQQKIVVSYKDIYSLSANDLSNVYYDNCQMFFCERVIAGKTFKTTNNLMLNNGTSLIYVYLNNYKPMKTRKLIVNIWRKDHTGFEFDELIDSKKFKVNPLWDYSFFRLSFSLPGEYKISVYNENESLIKYNFLQVF